MGLAPLVHLCHTFMDETQVIHKVRLIFLAPVPVFGDLWFRTLCLIATFETWRVLSGCENKQRLNKHELDLHLHVFGQSFPLFPLLDCLGLRTLCLLQWDLFWDTGRLLGRIWKALWFSYQDMSQEQHEPRVWQDLWPGRMCQFLICNLFTCVTKNRWINSDPMPSFRARLRVWVGRHHGWASVQYFLNFKPCVDAPWGNCCKFSNYNSHRTFKIFQILRWLLLEGCWSRG